MFDSHQASLWLKAFRDHRYKDTEPTDQPSSAQEYSTTAYKCSVKGRGPKTITGPDVPF